MLPAVSDLRFAHEIEAATLDHRRSAGKRVRPEEYCGAEDPLEGSDEATVLFPASMHPEALQHLSGGPESDCLALLLDSQSCQEDRNESVLPEGHTELGVARYLEDELTVPALIEKLILGKAPDRQTTKNERPRAEAQILAPLLAFYLDYFDPASAL